MGSFYWLASYPKSGNTWVRALLANYVQDTGQPADINTFDVGVSAASRLWFDDLCGIEASRLNDALVRRLRPRVYRQVAARTPERLFAKVHDAWEQPAGGEPLFPADVTAGVVYILRNPLDLVTSCAHHWGTTLEQTVYDICNPEHTISRSIRGLSEQLEQRVRCWSGHLRSWIEESGLRVLVVRYEDLLAEPERVFGEVVQFCGLPISRERVAWAVACSTFSELSSQERARGFRERSPRSSGPFFRQGKAGAWQCELPPELAARVIFCHRAAMARFGYLTDCATFPAASI